jgi:hypothetical protein
MHGIHQFGNPLKVPVHRLAGRRRLFRGPRARQPSTGERWMATLASGFVLYISARWVGVTIRSEKVTRELVAVSKCRRLARLGATC